MEDPCLGTAPLPMRLPCQLPAQSVAMTWNELSPSRCERGQGSQSYLLAPWYRPLPSVPCPYLHSSTTGTAHDPYCPTFAHAIPSSGRLLTTPPTYLTFRSLVKCHLNWESPPQTLVRRVVPHPPQYLSYLSAGMTVPSPVCLGGEELPGVGRGVREDVWRVEGREVTGLLRRSVCEGGVYVRSRGLWWRQLGP